MRCDMDFYVAVRGPLEQVRKLPGLAQEWFAALPEEDQTDDVKSDVEAMESSLEYLETLSEKDADKDGMIIAEWDGYSNAGLMYLQFLRFINEHPACQDVEVAATAKTNHSITDTVSYHSFRGQGKDGAIAPHFDEFCGFRLHIPLSVISRRGEKLEVDLLDLENAEDILIGSWRLAEMSTVDAMMAFDDEVYLFLQRKKNGSWRALLGSADLEYGMGGSKELKEKVLGMPESNGVSMCRLLEAGVHRFSFPKYSEKTVRELLEMLLPGKTLCLEMRNGKPFIWDEDGNEYFLGGVVNVDLDGITSTVDWRFPDGCEWIPKSLYENC